jgi:[ribosomal protein S5]-alanine N-acetyltransferase
MRYRDATAWSELRRRNAEWLRPWDPTPPRSGARVLTYRQMVRRMSAQARAGESFPWAVTYEGRLVGQCTVANVTYGSALSATIGYWVDQAVAGRGVIPTAVAMAIDHAFFTAGLHRIEINIRPENTASLRVVEKLGLRYEGRRDRLLHIDGDWRDHLSFAITVEEVPYGLLRRWHETLGRLSTP